MQQLILDPVVAVPGPRAVQRRRRRRLMVDDPMYIPVERMRDAIGDYRDTMRAEVFIVLFFHSLRVIY